MWSKYSSHDFAGDSKARFSRRMPAPSPFRRDARWFCEPVWCGAYNLTTVRTRTVSAWGIDTQWARMLAYITGLVDQELLLHTEYLAAENRILRAQLKGRLRLSEAERATLGEIGHRLGRKALAEVANAPLPDTILGWYRKLVDVCFDGVAGKR